MTYGILEDVNTVILIVINIGCLTIVIAMVDWWRRLYRVQSYLKPFIISIINIKSVLWFWSLELLLQFWFDYDWPILSLIGRALIMYSIVMQLWVIFHYRRR